MPVRAGSSITGPTSVVRCQGSPIRSASIAPVSILVKSVGDVLLHIEAAQGRTALACGLEGAFDDRLHGLFGQGGAVDDHRVQPAGFGNQRRAGGAGVRPWPCGFSCAVAVEPVKATPLHARIGGERRADVAAAGQQLQRGVRHACLVQQRDGAMGDQRRLLGRFGQHGIARGQCGADLAGENRQREVPRARCR